MLRDDFDTYRQHYYWFQYHFFLRSEYASRKDTLRKFLFDLLMDADTWHYKFELKERGEPRQEIRVRRPPRGMKQADALREHQKIIDAEPMPLKTQGKTWMPRIAQQKSIRCKYMLFDWLRTKNNKKWINFKSLYRSLIVFDLCQQGYNIDDIVNKFDNDLFLFQMRDYRTRLEYEDALWQLGFKGPELAPTQDSAIFFRSYPDEYDESQGARLLKPVVKKHYDRALVLIALAKTGNFKTLSLLPPLTR